MEALLTIEDLSLRFGEREVLSRLSLVVAPGARVALLGESGSGKSLTALSLLGLLPETCAASGAIHLRGQTGNLLDYRDKQWRKIRGREIGLIFQEPLTALNPTQRCGRQLLEAIEAYLGQAGTEATETAHAWLERVQLPAPARIMRAFPHELSGGQRQRLLIAMAMLAKPKLLIADEPTTALDTVIEGEILRLLRQLCAEEGMALLFITHDLAAARFVADEAILLKDGQTLERGSLAQLIESAKTDYGQRLVHHNARLHPGRRWPAGEIAGNRRAALRIRALSLAYPLQRNWLGRPVAWLQALRSVDLEIRYGELLALVGESGCGKTSLARCAAGLLYPDSGKIELIDAAGAVRPVQLGQIPLVFQDPFSSLTPGRAVGSQIEEVLSLHPDGQSRAQYRSEAEQLLQRVGLPPAEYYSRQPAQLSGGQRQRVAIARALATRSRILLCDEVTSALDAPLRHQLMQLLHQLCREDGLSLLYITHDLALALEWADRVAIMDRGQIVEVLPAGDAEQLAKHAITQNLLRALRL